MADPQADSPAPPNSTSVERINADGNVYVANRIEITEIIRDAASKLLERIDHAQKRDLEKKHLEKELEGAKNQRIEAILRSRDKSVIDRRISEIKEQLLKILAPVDGEVIDGRYRLDEIIGQGGFAVVWKAFDSVRDKTVAVKILHPQLAFSTSHVNRFFRGARVMGGLSHEGVATVIDPQVIDGFHHLYSLEYYERGDFQQAVLTGRLSNHAIARILLKVSHAIEHAHHSNVLHRDIKPSNILLDISDNPHITDFDLVHAPGTVAHTIGAIMGTYIYVAPEQLGLPGKDNVGPPADVYGLGMTTLFALTGRELDPSDKHDPWSVISTLPLNPKQKSDLLQAVRWNQDARWQTIADFREAFLMSLASLDIPMDKEEVAQDQEQGKRKRGDGFHVLLRKRESGSACATFIIKRRRVEDFFSRLIWRSLFGTRNAPHDLGLSVSLHRDHEDPLECTLAPATGAIHHKWILQPISDPTHPVAEIRLFTGNGLISNGYYRQQDVFVPVLCSAACEMTEAGELHCPPGEYFYEIEELSAVMYEDQVTESESSLPPPPGGGVVEIVNKREVLHEIALDALNTLRRENINIYLGARYGLTPHTFISPRLAHQFMGMDAGYAYHLPLCMVASLRGHHYDRADLIDALRAQYKDLEDLPAGAEKEVQMLSELVAGRTIVTGSYSADLHSRFPFSSIATEEAINASISETESGSGLYLPLHGILSSSDVLLLRQDVEQFDLKRPALSARVRQLLREPWIVLGFDQAADDTFFRLCWEVRKDGDANQAPIYVVDPRDYEVVATEWQRSSLRHVRMHPGEFLESASTVQHFGGDSDRIRLTIDSGKGTFAVNVSPEVLVSSVVNQLLARVGSTQEDVTDAPVVVEVRQDDGSWLTVEGGMRIRDLKIRSENRLRICTVKPS